MSATDLTLKRGDHGEFFAIDQLTWTRVCGLGMNPAVAFLVLARFSGRDNTTTAASTHAIEKYTGIARSRARVAIDSLLAKGVARHAETSTGTKPRYKLWASNAPKWIWLPNALVTGAASETPPVELIRQTQDAMTLRLLIELYWIQNLREDGGIDRRTMWMKYQRVRVAERGAHVVWGFGAGKLWIGWGSPVVDAHRIKPTAEQKAVGITPANDLFRRLNTLSSLHLLDWIPFILESGDADAEPIMPYGMGYSESIEDRIGEAADSAGRALLASEYEEAVDRQELRVVPLPSHLSRVEMIGIARLRYRPRTKLTAAWWGQRATAGEAWLTQFQTLVKSTYGESIERPLRPLAKGA